MLIAGPLLYYLFGVLIPASELRVTGVLSVVWLVIIAESYFTVRYAGKQIFYWYLARITLPQKEATKSSSDRVMVFSYFLPWMGITMIITGLLSWSYFSSQPADAGVEEMAFSCGGTAYIIALWVSHTTQKQAQIDIKAKLLRFEDDEVLSESAMYFLIHAWSGCIIVALFSTTRFLPWSTFTPLEVTLVDTLVAGLSTIVGALSGLLRTRARELNQGKNDTI